VTPASCEALDGRTDLRKNGGRAACRTVKDLGACELFYFATSEKDVFYLCAAAAGAKKCEGEKIVC